MSDALDKQLTSDTPIEGEDPNMVEAYRLVTGAYGFVHRMIRLFYNPHAITWAEVGVDGQVHKRHESAMAAGHYMLSGDFFENHERYAKFFELLEDPKGFRRYKNLVIDREDFNEETCQTPHAIAFGEQTKFGAPVEPKLEEAVAS